MTNLNIALLCAALLVTAAPDAGAASRAGHAARAVYDSHMPGYAAPGRHPGNPAAAVAAPHGAGPGTAPFLMPEGNGHVDEP